MTKSEPNLQPETVAASHGVAKDTAFHAVVPPIYLSSTYAFNGFNNPGSYDYGRSGNPTRNMLGDALAELEGGAGAVVTSSGMSAVDLLLGQLTSSGVIIAPHDCYGGTYRLLKARAGKGHFTVKFLDMRNLAELSNVLDAGASLVLVETPSNPLMRVVDIQAIARLAKKAGALTAVDNTFLSPALQTPLKLGADYVIHSTTKYLNGHSDVVGGAVIAADLEKVEGLRTWATVIGVIGSPMDSWMTLRGLRTLFPRILRQQETAGRLAEWLSQQKSVAVVHYPGLRSHPGHRLASKQQRGFGAMLSFELAGGTKAVEAFLQELKLFTFAESLGGVESLIVHPATMTHVDMTSKEKLVAGISDGLLRMSVGLEHPEDLLNDLKRAAAVLL